MTLPPEQIDVELAVIDTDDVTEFVVTVITLDVTVGVVVQFAFEVIITLIWFPLASELVVRVGELLPVGTPLICH